MGKALPFGEIKLASLQLLGHFGGTVLQRACGPRYRCSIQTISRCSRVHHEAAASDAKTRDMSRRHAERALQLRTVHRLPKRRAIFELSQRRLPDESIRSSATHKRASSDLPKKIQPSPIKIIQVTIRPRGVNKRRSRINGAAKFVFIRSRLIVLKRLTRFHAGLLIFA